MLLEISTVELIQLKEKAAISQGNETHIRGLLAGEAHTHSPCPALLTASCAEEHHQKVEINGNYLSL